MQGCDPRLPGLTPFCMEYVCRQCPYALCAHLHACACLGFMKLSAARHSPLHVRLCARTDSMSLQLPRQAHPDSF